MNEAKPAANSVAMDQIKAQMNAKDAVVFDTMPREKKTTKMVPQPLKKRRFETFVRAGINPRHTMIARDSSKLRRNSPVSFGCI